MREKKGIRDERERKRQGKEKGKHGEEIKEWVWRK
jgi:hypothetical protein